MTWSSKHQLTYLSIFAAAVIIILAINIYPYFNQPATCFDNKQNGGERGIDCGGICTTVCRNDAKPIIVLWTRAFKVAPGRYNLLSYVENQNVNATIKNLKYTFTVFDGDGVTITEKSGVTDIPPNGDFAIFESGIETGNRIPGNNTKIELDSSQARWMKIDQTKRNQINITVLDKKITDWQSSPLVDATLKNDSLYDIPNMNVIAIVSTLDGNAVNVSEYKGFNLPKSSSKNISFTWPEPFAGNEFSIEIIPEYDLDSIAF